MEFLILILYLIVGFLVYTVCYIRRQIKELWSISNMHSSNMDKVIDILKSLSDGMETRDEVLSKIVKVINHMIMKEKKDE